MIKEERLFKGTIECMLLQSLQVIKQDLFSSPTWRANHDWGAKLGYDSKSLANMNRKAIDLLVDIRQKYENKESPMVISGCIGPRGDGYNPTSVMSVDEAEQYRSEQIKVIANTEADMVTAITMNYSEEA